VAHGSFDSRTLDDFASRLAEWRANAYADPESPDILEPRPLPSVRTHDPAVETLVESEPTPLLVSLRRAITRLASDGVVQLNGDGGAGRGLRCVFSSSG